MNTYKKNSPVYGILMIVFAALICCGHLLSAYDSIQIYSQFHESYFLNFVIFDLLFFAHFILLTISMMQKKGTVCFLAAFSILAFEVLYRFYSLYSFTHFSVNQFFHGIFLAASIILIVGAVIKSTKITLSTVGFPILIICYLYWSIIDLSDIFSITLFIIDVVPIAFYMVAFIYTAPIFLTPEQKLMRLKLQYEAGRLTLEAYNQARSDVLNQI